MWLPKEVHTAVTKVARIHYVAADDCKQWNAARHDGELRLLTGWCWTAKGGDGRYRQGFKTMTCCARDAWYVLVKGSEVPALSRPRLRVVPANKARVA